MAEAGVALVTHGAGGLILPPIEMLRAAGVLVFAGNDDIRDTWSPYGTADLLERAAIIGWKGDFRRDSQVEIAFDLISAAGAQALGISDYGAQSAPRPICSRSPRVVSPRPSLRIRRGNSSFSRETSSLETDRFCRLQSPSRAKPRPDLRLVRVVAAQPARFRASAAGIGGAKPPRRCNSGIKVDHALHPTMKPPRLPAASKIFSR
jgi:hypothetical protein